MPLICFNFLDSCYYKVWRLVFTGLITLALIDILAAQKYVILEVKYNYIDTVSVLLRLCDMLEMRFYLTSFCLMYG